MNAPFELNNHYRLAMETLADLGECADRQRDSGGQHQREFDRECEADGLDLLPIESETNCTQRSPNSPIGC